MATVRWFTVSEGLNNRVESERLAYSEKTGVAELAEAYNIDVSNRGTVSRRLGFTATAITTDCHSLFCDGGVCLFVTGDALSVLGTDFVGTPIRNVTQNALMSYAQVNDVVYYVNGFEIGYVKDNKSNVWARPATVQHPDRTRVYDGPPTGTIVRFYASRIWVVVNNSLFYSDPYMYSLFRYATNFTAFPGKIILVAPSVDGMFISTDQAVYFMSGSPPQTTVVRKTSYPAVANTDVNVDATRVLGDKVKNTYLPMFTTVDGICIGLPGGELLNLTYEKLEYPRSLSGCSVYTGTKYITTLEP